jgi:hypothetical protein
VAIALFIAVSAAPLFVPFLTHPRDRSVHLAASPQPDETVISGKNDPVAADCAAIEAPWTKWMDERIVKVLITRSPKYGTIWRADVNMCGSCRRQKQPFLERVICSKDNVVGAPVVGIAPL